MPISDFKKLIWDYYYNNKRSFPWRENITPYKIMVSELMLQQTQVWRVEPKFLTFINTFPDFNSLAQTSFPKVLQLWQGLGYNRRAKFLWESAKIISDSYEGNIPVDQKELTNLPGIGYNTAGAILAYSFNIPTTFIETNIRRIFIHHFFNDQEDIHDKQLLPLIESTLDHQNPREWYWALMDYGTYLSKTVVNPNRKSQHYAKQSKFEGSDRQIRGEILKRMLSISTITEQELLKTFDPEQQSRIPGILEQLIKEGLVQRKDETLSL